MTLNEERLSHADEAFALHDFGPEVVKDTGGWNDDGQDTWSLVVYLENGDQPSVRVVFVVRFVPGSPDVNESYIAH